MLNYESMSAETGEKPSDLRTIYANRFDGADEYRNRVWQTLVTHFFGVYVPADGTVLDLGCGYGQFINNVSCRRKFGMDLNPASREKLAGDVTFLEQDCSAKWAVDDDSLDLVFTSNFFEHLPSKADLNRTVKEALRCLKPGGRIIALAPNIRYVGGAYWDFYDHYLPLTERSLQACLETAGFKTERIVGRFLPYTMVNTPQYPMFLLAAYLHMPLAWRFFGHQFLVIARKP